MKVTQIATENYYIILSKMKKEQNGTYEEYIYSASAASTKYNRLNL